MFCEKCHTKLEKDEIVCKRCGTKINSREKKSSLGSFSFNKKKKKQDHVYSDEDYFISYIGKNYEKFKSSFSIPAAIFGPFYCIYRKQWTTGIPFLIIYLMTYRYLPESLGTFIRLLSNLLIATKFNENYLEKATRQINYIKENHEKSPNEKLEQCKKEGRTLNLVILITIILLFFSTIIILQKANDIDLEEVNDLHLKNNQLIYNVPKKTKIKTNYINYQHLIDKTNNNPCYMTISSQTDSKTEIEYLSSLTHKKEEIEEINDYLIKWYHIQFKKESYEEIYVTKKGNTNMIYELHFTSSSINGCRKDIEKVLNTATWN